MSKREPSVETAQNPNPKRRPRRVWRLISWGIVFLALLSVTARPIAQRLDLELQYDLFWIYSQGFVEKLYRGRVIGRFPVETTVRLEVDGQPVTISWVSECKRTFSSRRVESCYLCRSWEPSDVRFVHTLGDGAALLFEQQMPCETVAQSGKAHGKQEAGLKKLYFVDSLHEPTVLERYSTNRVALSDYRASDARILGSSIDIGVERRPKRTQLSEAPSSFWTDNEGREPARTHDHPRIFVRGRVRIIPRQEWVRVDELRSVLANLAEPAVLDDALRAVIPPSSSAIGFVGPPPLTEHRLAPWFVPLRPLPPTTNIWVMDRGMSGIGVLYFAGWERSEQDPGFNNRNRNLILPRGAEFLNRLEVEIGGLRVSGRRRLVYDPETQELYLVEGFGRLSEFNL